MPLNFAGRGVDTLILKYLRLDTRTPDMTRWKDIVHRAYNPSDEVSIGIVGKYVEYEDSYKSLKEALVHGALAHNLKLRVTWIEAEGLETAGLRSYVSSRLRRHPRPRRLRQARHRRHAQRHPLRPREPGPLLRHLPRHADRLHRIRPQRLRPRDANSGEFDPSTPHRIIYKLRELTGVEEMGGTMRLGAWTCVMEPDSLAAHAYGTTEISERHRHRYEFNREYEALLTGAGLRLTGTTPDATYVEIVEIPSHPFFLGCQFHPEFKSRPSSPTRSSATSSPPATRTGSPMRCPQPGDHFGSQTKVEEPAAYLPS